MEKFFASVLGRTVILLHSPFWCFDADLAPSERWEIVEGVQFKKPAKQALAFMLNYFVIQVKCHDTFYRLILAYPDKEHDMNIAIAVAQQIQAMNHQVGAEVLTIPYQNPLEILKKKSSRHFMGVYPGIECLTFKLFSPTNYLRRRYENFFWEGFDL